MNESAYCISGRLRTPSRGKAKDSCCCGKDSITMKYQAIICSKIGVFRRTST